MIFEFFIILKKIKKARYKFISFGDILFYCLFLSRLNSVDEKIKTLFMEELRNARVNKKYHGAFRKNKLYFNPCSLNEFKKKIFLIICNRKFLMKKIKLEFKIKDKKINKKKLKSTINKMNDSIYDKFSKFRKAIETNDGKNNGKYNINLFLKKFLSKAVSDCVEENLGDFSQETRLEFIDIAMRYYFDFCADTSIFGILNEEHNKKILIENKYKDKDDKPLFSFKWKDVNKSEWEFEMELETAGYIFQNNTYVYSEIREKKRIFFISIITLVISSLLLFGSTMYYRANILYENDPFRFFFTEVYFLIFLCICGVGFFLLVIFYIKRTVINNR